METIPNPPKARVLRNEDKDRLEQWIMHFKRMSSRVLIQSQSDENFEKYINEAKRIADDRVGDIYNIADWPEITDIAFIIAIDSAFPGHKASYKPEDAYIFCFTGYAFGINYHQCDADHDDPDDDRKTFSLSNWSKDTLSWPFIARMIVSRISNLDNNLPKPPSS